MVWKLKFTLPTLVYEKSMILSTSYPTFDRGTAVEHVIGGDLHAVLAMDLRGDYGQRACPRSAESMDSGVRFVFSLALVPRMPDGRLRVDYHLSIHSVLYAVLHLTQHIG
jgi:hypothetical protein